MDAADEGGWTPLMYASHYGHYQVVRRLLAAGANPNVPQPTTGRTALMLAANNGHTRCIDRLVEGGALIGSRDRDGHDAAYYATQHGHGHNSLIANILGIPLSQRKPASMVRACVNPERRNLIAMAQTRSGDKTPQKRLFT